MLKSLTAKSRRASKALVREMTASPKGPQKASGKDKLFNKRQKASQTKRLFVL
jgi:hypothetical protein